MEEATDPELRYRRQGAAFMGAFFRASKFMDQEGLNEEQLFEGILDQLNKKFGKLGAAVVQDNLREAQSRLKNASFVASHQQWWHDYYNRWWNDMNIIADYPINKELIGGEAWWGKFCEQLAENYIRPGARFEMIQKADGWVQDSMSFKPLDRSVVRTKDLMLDDG